MSDDPRACGMTEPLGACIFPGCVSQDRHWHGGFPGGYDDPADPDGPPIPFTRDPDPGVRDYNGTRLTDLDDALAGTASAVESAITVTPPQPRRIGPPDPGRSRMGRQSRKYGNRAELDVARTYGGTKVGHAGGPVDVRGKDWNTQVKTHRRPPPAEWRTVFAKLEASTDRLPRLLLRFVMGPGTPPVDYVVVPGKAWLDWFGKDEGEVSIVAKVTR